MKARDTFALYVRSFVFGVEDSLVSTTGLLSGVAVAGVPKATIFLTGLVLIFVEAFSMGVGSFLSEQSAQEFISKKNTAPTKTIQAGAIMFFSYFAAGFIPLTPYIIFETAFAFWLAIIFALVALFLLGSVSARFFGTNILRTGLRMLLVGGGAVIIGVVVGQLVHTR